MKPLIADQLMESLSRWNTSCTLSDQPEYRTWLASRFPHWPFAEDFSRFAAETVDDTGMDMLWKDDLACIGWQTPAGVMDTPDEFVREGFLVIGTSPDGNPLVIDTHEASGLQMGFVSHEVLWGEEAAPRAAFRPWPDSLLVFLDKLWADPSKVHI